MFLLGHDSFLAGQIETVVTLAMVNPDCTVNFFLTEKQLNPSRFGNKNYMLIVLEAASHSVRGTVMQDTTAIVRFTLHHSGKIPYN